MIYYVNAESKRCVTRNNGISVKPISLEYDITEELQFQFLNNNNQIIDISGLSGLSLAIGLHLNKNSYDLLALSNDFTIQDNTLSFTINTYTQNWLKDIQKPNTEAYIEISQQSLNAKKVLLRTYCYVYPRVYVAGLSPQEIDSNDYYTKSEVDELISSIVISGYATEEYVNNAVATKQDIIDADNKLSYALVRGAPTIPTKTSDLTNDSGFITDSALQEYATETYVNSSVSGKADKSEIPTKTSDLQNDSGFITENALSGKQDKITAENKLAYSLISGTPTIPTKTSDLTNDSDFQSASQVQTAISGKQDKITSASKLDYALLSGTPTIPTKTSDLQNDSGFVDANYVADATSAFVTETTFDEALSGKQDVINNDNWLSARYVRTELEPWIGDPEYTVDAAINMVHQEALEAIEGLSGKADKSSIPSAVSQLTNDEGFVTSAYVDSQINEKQDKITSISKLDYALLSGTPTIPTKTSDLTNDSGFITDSALQGYATETYVNSSVSGKADKSEIPLSTSQLTNDSRFITEDALSGKQDKITSENKLAYDLISGAPAESNPVNVTFEKKNTLSAGVFTADFNGKQIQKYGIDYAARDKIEIQLENAETIPSGTAPTIELQVPSFGAESIIFPSSVQLIDELPETIENITGKLTYHDIVFRAEKDEKDAVKVYANYAYKFSEDEVDYLYIEAVDDGDIIKLTTQYGSPTIPTLYYSYDKVNWNSVLLDADINLLNAGDKVYFKGDNTIINTPENRVTFSSTGRVNMGGNLFTILSEDGIPSGIQYSCFNSFLRGMTALVSVKNLIIPDIEYTGDSSMIATTNVYYAMFRDCTSLIDIPIMKQKYVYKNMFYAMFRGCTALTIPYVQTAIIAYSMGALTLMMLLLASLIGLVLIAHQ